MFWIILQRILYTQPPAASKEHLDDFLNGLDLPKIKYLQNEMLVNPIMVKDLNLGISRLKSGKTPGSDGFTE